MDITKKLWELHYSGQHEEFKKNLPVKIELDRDQVKLVIRSLENLKIKEAANCDTWKDSGDRGACYAYKVSPIDEILNYLKNN